MKASELKLGQNSLHQVVHECLERHVVSEDGLR